MEDRARDVPIATFGVRQPCYVPRSGERKRDSTFGVVALSSHNTPFTSPSSPDSDRQFVYARTRCRRYSVGDWPMIFLNTRIKWVRDWKPTSYAISLMRRLGLSKRFLAFSIRTRET